MLFGHTARRRIVVNCLHCSVFTLPYLLAEEMDSPGDVSCLHLQVGGGQILCASYSRAASSSCDLSELHET